MITELPSFISMLNDMKILDLRACHNLELIPDNIGLLKNLTHLDMSECYFLEYMPKGIAELSNLKVLKGFIVGDYGYEEDPCTLYDLSILQKLRKLNIYTNSEDFPYNFELWDIAKLEGLQNLTINWGGYPFVRGYGGHTYALQAEKRHNRAIMERVRVMKAAFLFQGAGRGNPDQTPSPDQTLSKLQKLDQTPSKRQLPSKLQKMDLLAFPGTSLPYG
ncbi:hypothetical protein Vadar_028268 [Vaccinium darrowii]|uniref:Uncharacterized protein n=1 Tax=Vaccinium darrowii TaxID=229202 RepID=A0ACB7XCY6_9ERIC|nr:hypothetical protein Vadar_028268 [Vaccinium darrowii]